MEITLFFIISYYFIIILLTIKANNFKIPIINSFVSTLCTHRNCFPNLYNWSINNLLLTGSILSGNKPVTGRYLLQSGFLTEIPNAVDKLCCRGFLFSW